MKRESQTALSALRQWYDRVRLSLALVALTVLCWQIYSSFFNEIGDQYLPSPLTTLQQSYAHRYDLAEGLLYTGGSAMVGLVLAIIIGVLLGALLAESYYVRQGFLPAIVFAYALPAAVLAPVFVIWFGTGLPSVIAFATWISFFTVFVNTVTGLTAVDEEFEQLGDLLGASRLQMLWHVKLWVALPYIASGIRVAVTLSVVGTIIAEFIATGGGLGGQIIQGLFGFELGWVFGVLATIMLFSITLYKLASAIITYATPTDDSLS
jgi:NitT/TauT family transport system permease protein